MADEKIKVEIAAEYDDTEAKKALADAEKIEQSDPTVEVTLTADNQASDDIAKVQEEAQALSGQDVEIVLRAKADALKGELREVEAQLKQTEEQAQRTNRQLDDTTRGGGGSNLRGNAIADLTGPLGEASGAASDFAGVFDGLGDISESVASKVGVSAATMTSAITGIGVAIAAGAAVWTVFRQKQEAARKKQEELVKGQRELNEALQEGDFAKAGQVFIDTYGDMINAADQFGVSASEATKFITGQTDALPSLNAKIAELQQRIDGLAPGQARFNGDLFTQVTAMREVRDELGRAAQDYRDTNGTLAEQDRRLRAVSASLGNTTTNMHDLGQAARDARGDVDVLKAGFDILRGAVDFDQAMIDFRASFAEAANTTEETMDESASDVNSFKQLVIDTAEQLGRSPLEVKTVLDKVDQGDLYGAKADVENWFKMHPIILASKLDRPGQLSRVGGDNASGTAFAASAAPINVNVNMPRGSRGVDVLRQVSHQARRSGRRYGVPVVHYARTPR